MTRILTSCFLLVATLLTATAATKPTLAQGSGVLFQAADLPSSLWPQFVETTRDIEVADSKTIKNDTRAVLLRVEGDELLLDFGRNGISKVNPKDTDFYTRVHEFMTGTSTKEFPNFALQIGNKMMTFGRGSESGPIRFKEAEALEIYILLYLQDYDPDFAQELFNFGLAYDDLKEKWPSIEVVLMPRDRKFYDFGATVGYSVPFIAPHMRAGYINSLQHGIDTPPGFVAVDNNGRILARSEAPVAWDHLIKELEGFVQEIGIPWSASNQGKRSAYKRSASWNN